LLVRQRTLPPADLAIFEEGLVVPLAAEHSGGLEAAAKLQCGHRAYAAKSVSDGGLELVEDRLAQPCRHAARDDLDGPAGRVARLADLV